MSHEIGSIEPGKRADLVITAPMESLAALPYYYCRDQVETMIINGKEVGEE